MNYFLELELYDEEGTVLVRPEHVSAIEPGEDEAYVIVRMNNTVGYCVKAGQVFVNKLIHRTQHAGMRVL